MRAKDDLGGMVKEQATATGAGPNRRIGGNMENRGDVNETLTAEEQAELCQKFNNWTVARARILVGDLSRRIGGADAVTLKNVVEHPVWKQRNTKAIAAVLETCEVDAFTRVLVEDIEALLDENSRRMDAQKVADIEFNVEGRTLVRAGWVDRHISCVGHGKTLNEAREMAKNNLVDIVRNTLIESR